MVSPNTSSGGKIKTSYAVTHEDNIALLSYLAHHFVSSNVDRNHFSSSAHPNGPFGKPTSKKRTVLRKTLSNWISRGRIPHNVTKAHDQKLIQLAQLSLKNNRDAKSDVNNSSPKTAITTTTTTTTPLKSAPPTMIGSTTNTNNDNTTNTNTNAIPMPIPIPKVPDVYILMGPVSVGKSTALKCIKEKLNPLKVMVASGEYKSEYFYPTFPLALRGEHSTTTTINGITPLQVGAYYALLMAVNDAMKKNKDGDDTGTTIDAVIMETALTPQIGQPLLDSPMVKKFIFMDAENHNMIVERRIQRDYIDKDIICTDHDQVTISKLAQDSSNDYINVMRDAKKQGKLAAGSGSNDIVLIKESHTPDQVADLIIANVEEWHQYIVSKESFV